MAETRQQQQQELLSLALKAAKNAFCTFSKQRLGVSIKGSDGRMRAGCTFDSAAFPCSICAAHVAVAQTATEGRALVAECAVVEIVDESGKGESIFPLKGCCLEWLCEYAHSDEVYVHAAVLTNTQVGGDRLEEARTFKLSELLPQGRRLPRPCPTESLSLSVVKGETEGGLALDGESTELIQAAVKAAAGSCCWRSGVSVGCSLLTEGGIVTGANAETSALGIGCCAEQNAIGYAFALGRKRILKAAVVCTAMPQAACHPCGRCLQLLLQAQERTRADAAAAAPAPAAAEAQPQQLVLLMPWRQGGDNADGQNSWRVKTRLLDEMGQRSGIPTDEVEIEMFTESNRPVGNAFEIPFESHLDFIWDNQAALCSRSKGAPVPHGVTCAERPERAQPQTETQVEHPVRPTPAVPHAKPQHSSSSSTMAAADSNGPFRLLGYHRHVTSLQLAANHPFYEETAGRCLDTEVTTAFGNRCLPRLISQIQASSCLSREQRLEALLCLGECITNPEQKIRAIELGAVSAVHPLLKPGPPRGPYAGYALERKEETGLKRLDGYVPQASVYGDDKGDSRFSSLRDSPLQRAGCIYLAGNNALSPAAAWGICTVGDTDAYAALQAAVLQLLISLSRSTAARREMQMLRVFQEAAELFISHPLPQIRLLSSELLAGVCGEDDGSVVLAAAGEPGLSQLRRMHAGVDSHLASFLCASSWAVPPPETRELLRNALVAACSVATQPAARARMVTSSLLVPAATRLLWLLSPELSCLEEVVDDGASEAAAAVSLEGLAKPSPLPAFTAALETASMSVGAGLTRVAAAAEAFKEKAGPLLVSAACKYTRIMWATGASEPLNLLCRIGCTEEGRQALVDNADFIRLLPLLLKEPTERQWRECELQRRLQVQQVPLQRGELLPLVVQVLRSACAVPAFQHELYKHLKRRRQVMYEVLGVAAMKPAAALLAEALERMQLKERDLLQTELDEPHDGWLRFLIESDYAYKDACTDALQALALMEFTLEKSAAFEPSVSSWNLR
ncbi:hypothetical protein Esti_006020 [Eimeria stiedai]